ncbi:MAG: mersacidin/lichenicidin family type 2 lantibiotic [Acidobacteriota bacterium]
MKKIDVTRALRDSEYRASLTEAERATLPEHPAGITTVADEALRSISGGCGPSVVDTCPPAPTTPAYSCTIPMWICP